MTIRDPGDIDRMVSPPKPDPVESVAHLAARGFPGTAVTRLLENVQITIPGEAGVSALLTATRLEVRLPTVRWESQTPVAGTRLYHRYNLAPAITETMVTEAAETVRKLLARGLAARNREFHECRFCGRRTPPELRHSADVCHGCAERHLGVVH